VEFEWCCLKQTPWGPSKQVPNLANSSEDNGRGHIEQLFKGNIQVLTLKKITDTFGINDLPIHCMKLCLTVPLLFFLTTSAYSQDIESDEHEPAAPGVYLSFENFITNTPIDPETLLTDLDPYSAGFYLQLARETTVEYVLRDSTARFNPSRIWGYCDGRSIWVNRSVFPQGFFSSTDVTEHPFAKISFLGELSLIHFVRNQAPQANQWSGASKGMSKPVEFILDSRDGQIHKASLKNLERLIETDLELLDEFRKHKKDPDIKLYVFLKKYNRRHPFAFK
jgi:hypothetical protein